MDYWCDHLLSVYVIFFQYSLTLMCFTFTIADNGIASCKKDFLVTRRGMSSQNIQVLNNDN